MALMEKLHSTKMARGEGVTFYLTRLTQIRDELAEAGDTIPEEELVRIAFNGFGKQWDVFFNCVVGKAMMPTWERLWDDFTQEEIWEGSQCGEQKKKSEDEDNLALETKGKEKSKKSSAEGTSSRQGSKKKFDTSKNRVHCLPSAWAFFHPMSQQEEGQTQEADGCYS
jgi:hypothetical protein